MKVVLFLFLAPFLAISQQNCEEVPVLNQKVVRLADAQMNKKVGSGECWDLAKLVLDESGAEWDGFEQFGRAINHNNDCIFPGDVVQFKNVKLEWVEGKYTYYETMKHHTAIVYEVKQNGTLVLIHQNTGQHGRIVGTSSFRLEDRKKGKITVYRPQAATD